MPALSEFQPTPFAPGTPVQVANRFTAQVTLAAGQHTIEAVAKAGRLTDRDTVSVNVTLSAQGGGI